MQGVGQTADFLTGGVGLHEWYVVAYLNPYASGRTYVGYQAATAHDLSEPEVTAFAVWLTYGVR